MLLSPVNRGYLNLFNLLGCILMALMLSGCDGNSSSSSATANTGIFVDSPVEGLNYKTTTLNGVTGPNGEFQYHPGEIVTFSIGDVVLGSVAGASVITPLHLGASFSVTDSAATNISRLLQSLDVDGNLDNGINITPEIRAEMTGRSFLFTKPVADFEDNDIKSLFEALNNKMVFKYSGQGKLRTALEAQVHLSQTLLFFSNHRSTAVFPHITSIHRPYRNLTTAVIRPPGVFPHITSIIRPPRPFRNISITRDPPTHSISPRVSR